MLKSVILSRMTNQQDPGWLPDKIMLQTRYAEYLPGLETVIRKVEEELKTCIKVSSLPRYIARVKSFNSYYRKLIKTLSVNQTLGFSFPLVTDLLGVRIICAFLQDLTEVEKQLCTCFNVVEVERKGADRTFREFGYESTHILVEVPERFYKELKLPPGLLFEIQIRTILQDAWAEVEHELIYKTEFTPFDLPLKRKLASINASLSLADIIFQEIRDYQTRLNRELDTRRGSFYQQADTVTEIQRPDKNAATLDDPSVDTSTLNEVAQDIADPALTYVQGTIDDMLLEAIQAHNQGNLPRAILIYTKIIEAAPNSIILSVIYKHRGMAYFASSRYEQALSDFTESARCNPENYRAYYYVGIVLSAMGKEPEALENFDISLRLNRFQPYVYFRRAHSCYELARYSDALKDLDTAVSLGLKDEDDSKLRMMIARKLDI